MLYRCPVCAAPIRMVTPEFRDKTVRYLCQACEQIVSLDLFSDEIQTSSSPAKPEVPHTARILVVDDALSFQKLAQTILAREGYSVVLASDGIEALKKITEEHPDAMLLDLFMPKMSGFEVLRTLRTSNGYKNFKNLPVLVTSGSYNPAEIEILHDLGANGYISKEAISDFLVYRIRRILPKTVAQP